MKPKKVIARWLQLSDLHIFDEADTSLILEDYKKLANAFHPDFIVVTGDFRHKKHKTTFEKTIEFLEEILKIFNVSKKDIFLVPGNHDVNNYRNRSKAICEIQASSDNNYNAYYKYIHRQTSLYKAFEEYDEFVKTFYKDSGVCDARIINPSFCFNICWNNKINLFHINTALISNGENSEEIVDINEISKCSLNLSCPTIILAHHGLESIYSSQQARIKKVIGNKNISAYLHGDIHKYKSNPIHPFHLTNYLIPQISCGKSVPQSNDNYSDIGIVTYTWYDDNNTYVDAYRWVINKEFVIDNTYKTKLDESYYFPMLLKNDASSILSNESDKSAQIEEYSECSEHSERSEHSEHSEYSERLEYIDRIAIDISKNKKLPLLTEAILETASFSNTKQKKSWDKLENICNMIIKSNSKYPLIIKGEPGTGKSTLLSSIYIKLKENPFFNLELIDLHFYDEWSPKQSIEHFEKKLNEISKLVDLKKKLIIFIDGIDLYKRIDLDIQKKLVSKIETWESNEYIQIVFSVGDLNNTQSKQFSPSNIKIPTNAEAELTLHPFNTNSSRFNNLVKKILNSFNILNNHNNIDNRLNQQFVVYFKKIAGNTIDFRTIALFIELNKKIDGGIFTEKAGIILLNHFQKKLKLRKIKSIGKKIGEFMLNNSKPNTNYLYKGTVIRDFFFSYYYVNLINNNLFDKLKSFDYIFTASINRFCVDLMYSTPDCEISAIEKLITAYDHLTQKGKNQVVYLIGRVKSRLACQKAEIFLLKLYSEMKEKFAEFQENNETMMLFRSIGISLLNIGNTKYSNDFYSRLIYNKKLRQINRNFYIVYYLSDSYKISADIDFDDCKLSTHENISHLYNILYHSIKKSSQRELQYVSIITLINLVIYDHYKNQTNFCSRPLPDGFCELLNTLLSNTDFSNDIVSEYISVTKEHLMHPNIYAETFSKIYALKKNRRAGWYKPGREINKTELPESVSEHIWGCCMIAQLFLTENPNNCHFFSSSETCTCFPEYSKEHIISLLLIHDLPEAYTGDIPDDPQKKAKEEKFMNMLPALNSFPYFYSFDDIKSLWDEYEKKETINSKIANDIDKLEALIQLFIYRDILVNDSKLNERNNWMQQVQEQLLTNFGKKFYEFLEIYLLSDNAFQK